MNTKLIAIAVLVIAVLGISGLAFAGFDNGSDAGSPTQTPGDGTTPPPTSTPVPATPDRTGIDAIDRAIAAVLAGDSAALARLIALMELECAAPTQGAGGPPVCRDGETPGTPVRVLPTTSCEGSYAGADELAGEIDRFLASPLSLEGVYEAGERTYPDGAYVVVLSYADASQGSLARTLVMSGDGVTGLQFGCGDSPESLIERQGLSTPVFVP